MMNLEFVTQAACNGGARYPKVELIHLKTPAERHKAAVLSQCDYWLQM
jgi:hypothetical protein